MIRLAKDRDSDAVTKLCETARKYMEDLFFAGKFTGFFIREEIGC